MLCKNRYGNELELLRLSESKHRLSYEKKG